MKLAVIDDTNGKVTVLKILGDGDVATWEERFRIAAEAIEYQEKHNKLEEFNNLHLNLLLTNLIKQRVINRQGVNLDPLIRKRVEIETARKAWHFSRKKRLMNQFEIEHQKLKGTFQEALFKRAFVEGVLFLKNWAVKFIPQPIKNIYQTFKDLIEKYERIQ